MSDTSSGTSGTSGDGHESGPTSSGTGAGAHPADAPRPPEQQYAPPGQQQYPPSGQQQYGGQYGGPPVQQGNGLAVAGLVLGILGVLFGFIPFVGVFMAILLGALGAIFGAVGLSRSKQPYRGGRGMAIAGLVLGIIAIILGFLQGFVIGAAVDDLNQDLDQLDQELQQDLDQFEEDLEQDL